MALTIKHTKVSAIPDGADTGLVRPSDWNADHALTGVATIAQGGTNAATAADARTSLGVPSTTGTGATGSWGINITGTSDKASNLASAGGSENKIPVQSAPSVTTFINAPTASGQVLSYDGTTIAWAAGGGGSSLLGVTQSVTPYETSLGFEAGLVNTGANNTYVGYQAGRACTGATNNVVMGFQAMDVATIPSDCVVIGSSACGTTSNTLNNVIIGSGANAVATSNGGDNTYIGKDAARTGTGSGNVVIGSGAGNGITTLANCVGIGNGVFGTATSGATGAVAIGNNALGSLSSGLGNIGIGQLAGTIITTGASNTCIGHESGKAITTNNLNTFVGFRTGLVTTGGSNTFVGANVGNIITTGFGNTLIGSGAASNITTGTNNTVIGNGLLPAVNASNYVALFDGVGDLAVMFNDPGAMTFNGTDYGGAGSFLRSAGSTGHPTWTYPNQQNVASITANTQLSSTVSVYFVDATAGDVTATLPSAGANIGVTMTVKRTDSSANNVTVASAGGFIENGASASLGPEVSIIFCSDGSNWWELANG